MEQYIGISEEIALIKGIAKGKNEEINYSELTNIPTINGVALTGDMTSADLGIDNLPIYICAQNEYDAETRRPTILNPSEKIFYLVPGGRATNLYEEWIWKDGVWEEFGKTEIDLAGYVQKTRTVNGNALSSDVVLNGDDISVSQNDNTKISVSLGNVQVSIDSVNNSLTVINEKFESLVSEF